MFIAPCNSAYISNFVFSKKRISTIKDCTQNIQMVRLLALVCLLPLLAFTVDAVTVNCYKNWSRCTPQTSFLTGVLWYSCRDRCRNCNGKESGYCARVENKECSGGYQCKCTGGSHPKSDSWKAKILCRLGL